jgi:hypothetical protein
MFRTLIISVAALPLTVSFAFSQSNTMTSGRRSAALNPEQCEVLGRLLTQSRH